MLRAVVRKRTGTKSRSRSPGNGGAGGGDGGGDPSQEGDENHDGDDDGDDDEEGKLGTLQGQLSKPACCSSASSQEMICTCML